MALPGISSTWEQVFMSRRSRPIPSMFVSPQYLSFSSSRIHVYLSKSLIGDGILVWRVYIVWRKDRRVIILPVSNTRPSLRAARSNQLSNYRSCFYWEQPVIRLWCINRSQLAFAGLPLTSLDSMLATLSSSFKLLLG